MIFLGMKFQECVVYYGQFFSVYNFKIRRICPCFFQKSYVENKKCLCLFLATWDSFMLKCGTDDHRAGFCSQFAATIYI